MGPPSQDPRRDRRRLEILVASVACRRMSDGLISDGKDINERLELEQDGETML